MVQAKQLSSILIILALAVSPAVSINAHVFLIVGQSNSVGLNTDGFIPDDGTNDRIGQLSCCKNGQTLPTDQCVFIVAKDPLHHQCDDWYQGLQSVGFGLSFAKEVLKTLPPDDRVMLIPAGISGTGFFDNVWPAYTGRGFTAAIDKLRRAMSLLTTMNLNPTFDGILWHQGELDAGDNGAGNVADTNFYLNQDIIPLIKAFRDTNLLPFTSPRVPFVAGNLLPSWGFAPAHGERRGVVNAIALLDQMVPFTASVPSQGLLGDPVFLGSTGELIHFTARSLRILGRRYFDAWLLAQNNMPE